MSGKFLYGLRTKLHFADVGLTWEPVMSTGMRVSLARMRMSTKKHRKPTIDQCTGWRIEGIVLETVRIELYISDL